MLALKPNISLPKYTLFFQHISNQHPIP